MAPQPDDADLQRRFGLSAAERADVKIMVRYALTIMSAVAITLLIVMLASTLLAS